VCGVHHGSFRQIWVLAVRISKLFRSFEMLQTMTPTWKSVKIVALAQPTSAQHYTTVNTGMDFFFVSKTIVGSTVILKLAIYLLTHSWPALGCIRLHSMSFLQILRVKGHMQFKEASFTGYSCAERGYKPHLW